MAISCIAALLLVASGGATAAEPAVRATLVGERPGRPPLTRLLVDVSVTNDAAAPRWVLIPSSLPPRDTGGGVDHLEQKATGSGDGRVAIGRLLGRAGTYALYLAPGARITLRQLEIGWWGEPPAASTQIAFEVRLAAAVTIDGQPLARWFDGDPTIRGTAELDMASAPHTHSRRAPEGRELPLALNEARPLTVQLVRP